MIVPVLAGIGALVFLAGRKSSAEPYPVQTEPHPSTDPQAPLCTLPPPTPQIQPPPGWVIFRGRPPSSRAVNAARSALSMPLGAFTTFQDEDGQTRGILLQWHCHERGERGPQGWHKGATVCERDSRMADGMNLALNGDPTSLFEGYEPPGYDPV